MDNNTRNTTIFIVCATALILLYQTFVMGPIMKRREAEQRAHQAAAASTVAAVAPPGSPAFVTRAEALAGSPRTPIDTPALQGSIALKGGRIDDLFLKDYKETLAKNSPPVELFRPEGAKNAYFFDAGWTGPIQGPGPLTLWTQTSQGPLTPGHPVTLTWDNGQGLLFTRTIAVDERYMFTVSNTVTNKGSAPVQLAAYASVQRQGTPTLTPNWLVNEGAVGSLGGVLKEIAFKNWKKNGDQGGDTTGGYMGITDKYWLAAVIPDQKEPVRGEFKVSTVNGADVYEADYVGQAKTLAPGAVASETTRLFAGAKKVSILQDYEKALSIPHFDDAVDWGWLWFLTRPMFVVLELFFHLFGNFGLAILGLTVVVKLLMFPLASKSYESMSKMKKLQPEIEAIKKRFPDDPAKQQQETMAFYQRERVNPLAGCVTMLPTIPVFYALYTVLTVTIEMRHAPFFGWIHDLSAPDPTTFVNLFGLIPWNPATTPVIGNILDGPLHLGVWPLLYGFAMWLNTAMTPQQGTDPTQKLMMQIMPLMFVFIMGRYPAGLLIYWTWSVLLSIAQQYFIMHRYKAENPIDDLIAKLRGKSTTLPAKV
jgi:YidC/Oxa1 family membrane protein insertase